MQPPPSFQNSGTKVNLENDNELSFNARLFKCLCCFCCSFVRFLFEDFDPFQRFRKNLNFGI